MPEPFAKKIASEAIWEAHKNTIKHLYLSEDKSLMELQKVMKSVYDFDASKSRYERYFKKWGFRKNLKGQEWKAVSHHLGKRKRAGRESELYVDGVLVPKKKVQKETSRNGFMTSWERYAQAPSPKLPAGVVVCTPPSLNLEPFATENIPWFQYRSILWSQGIQFWISTSLNFRPDFFENGTSSQKASHPLVAFQSAVGTLASETQRGIPSRKFWTMNSYIMAVMPEAYAQGYEDFLQRLLGPCHEDTMMQCIAVIIYLASNNLRFPTENTALTISQWLFLPDNLGFLRRLLSIKGPTTEALAEYLFGLAIEAENMIVIKTMLQSAINPNSSRTRMFRTPLQHASQNGNVELTRLLLQAGAEVDAAPSTYLWDSFTPLMLAVQAQKADLVDLLVSAGANVNMENQNGDTALILATRLGNIDSVRNLIRAGADVNSADGVGERVFRLAVDTGSTELIKCILDADPQAIGSAILSATSQGELGIVKMLLGAGADIDYPSHEGLTALTLAIIKKNAELAEYLLREGANVNGLALRHPVANRCPHEDCPCGNWNSPPITPLQAASIRDMTEFARILLQAGADVNTSMYCQHKCRFFLQFTVRFDSDDDSDGRVKFIHYFKLIGNALQIAAHRQNQELTEILLEAGANVNAAASKSDGRTALQAAVEKGNKRLIKCLLDAGADPNVAAAKYGKTALQAAVKKEDATLVKYLLDAGANVNVQCSSFGGRTTLQAAVERGNKDLVKYLLGAGANANAAASDYGGRTALQVAAEKGDSDLIKWILDAGADINEPPGKHFGVTALTAAVKRGDLDLVSLLLNAGADVNHPSAASCGGSALGAAVMKNDLNLIRFLLGNGADWADPDALLSAVVTENFELVAILLKRVKASIRLKIYHVHTMHFKQR